MKFLRLFKNWSILFFIIPLYIALFFHLYFYGLVIFTVMANSFIYHYWNEQKFIYSDKVLAYCLICCNLLYSWLGNFSFPYFYVALCFAVVALYFYFKKPENKNQVGFNHGIWHIASAFITIFCLLTYLAVH